VCQSILDAVQLVGKINIYVPAMDWDMIMRNALPMDGRNEMISHLQAHSRKRESVTLQPGLPGIISLVATTLDTEADDLDPNAPLANYGLDSLTSIRLSTLLQTELGLSVSQLQLLSGYCTISRLQEMLQENEFRAPGTSGMHGEVGDPTASLPWNIPEAEMGKTVVPLNGVSDGAPLFICHGAGGGVLVLQQLAGTLPFPVFGLQDTPSAPIEGTLQDLAAFYLQELLKVQPKGPYRLAGYSFGTVVATIIANMLCERSDTVECIIFLDSSPLALLSEDFARHLRQTIVRSGFQGFITTFVDDLIDHHVLEAPVSRQIQDYFEGRAGADWVHRYVTAFRSHVHMAYRAGYELRMSGKMTAIGTSDETRVLLIKGTRGTAAEEWATGDPSGSLYLGEVPNLEVVSLNTTHAGIICPDSGSTEALVKFLSS
jgi:fatty acid synthase